MVPVKSCSVEPPPPAIDPVPVPDAGEGVPGARPEIGLLLACLRVDGDPGRVGRISPGRQVDWTRFVEAAIWHAVAPAVHRRLGQTGAPAVPSAVRDRLRARHHENTRRNLLLTGELIALAARFEEEGLSVAPFRGPVLAQQAYGDLAAREFVDLDLLVRRQDVSRAVRLLTAWGYQPTRRLDPLREAAYETYWSDHEFHDATRHVRVEIHWALDPPRFVVRNPAGLWTRLHPVRLSGTTLRTMSPEDTLLVLCTHGAKHLWTTLGWLNDVAHLVMSYPRLDWHRVLAEARALGVRRRLSLGLVLTRDLLGLAIPAAVVGALETGPVVGALAARVRERVLRDEAPPADALGAFRFQLSLMDDWRSRARFCFMPTLTEVEWMPLPRPLYPLYYAARLARLCVQHGPALVGRLGPPGAQPARGMGQPERAHVVRDGGHGHR